MPIRAAQLFEEHTNTPTKVSIHLNPIGVGEETSFTVTDNITVDALNFSLISQNPNKLVIEEDVTMSTGHGVIRVYEYDADAAYARVYYPITFATTGTYSFWLRVQMPAGVFNATMFIDDEVLVDIAEIGASSTEFVWISTSFDISDTNEHVISIRPETDDTTIDKIYVTSDSNEMPVSLWKEFDSSPYMTVHCRVYTTSAGEPDTALFIYDHKTTISDIRTRGWYNFNLNFLTNAEAINYDGIYAIVVYSSGSDSQQYMVWEQTDDTNNNFGASAIKG